LGETAVQRSRVQGSRLKTAGAAARSLEFGVRSNSGSTFKGSKFKVKNSGRCSAESGVWSNTNYPPFTLSLSKGGRNNMVALKPVHGSTGSPRTEQKIRWNLTTKDLDFLKNYGVTLRKYT